jgi:hypothetical protein
VFPVPFRINELAVTVRQAISGLAVAANALFMFRTHVTAFAAVHEVRVESRVFTIVAARG